MLLQLTILRPWECATTALVRFPNQLLTSNNKTNSDRLTNILAMTMTQSLSHLSSRMLVMITTKKHTSTIMGSPCSAGWSGSRQSSCSSQISKIIFVEKKLSCGDILGNFLKFWEILENFATIIRFHVEKNWAQKYISGEKYKIDKYEVWIATKKEHLATSTIAGPTQQRDREKKSTATCQGWMCWIVLDFRAVLCSLISI